MKIINIINISHIIILNLALLIYYIYKNFLLLIYIDITEIAASTTMVPHTTDHNRIDANKNPINHVAHSKNISAIQNGSNTQASIVKSSVDDVSSTIDSITDGSTLKKRNLPTKDNSGSQSIGARVKGLRRPAKKKQRKPPDSPGSTQYK